MSQPKGHVEYSMVTTMDRHKTCKQLLTMLVYKQSRLTHCTMDFYHIKAREEEHSYCLMNTSTARDFYAKVFQNKKKI
ncbi:hypothetical protein N7462_007447 [Penicillium macrosclerotiorum]|uniref:uncharacterized protein n=1 Tax=Penicillium macrosclerotiorum TaxID=303699 RepID=UPI002547C457|nr:uncharacterized protein N7462_007447 [Penicillium macrosclerotiorum]KAJ5679203.1 hypothetical protein N7462_007447 [Penicillium macrosclerotiorum]